MVWCEYPLKWPPNKGRTPTYLRRDTWPFRRTVSAFMWHEGLDKLEKLLDKIDAQDVVVFTNSPLRKKDARPRQPTGPEVKEDPGISVRFWTQGSWTPNNGFLWIAIDEFRDIRDNLAALVGIIERLIWSAQVGGGLFAKELFRLFAVDEKQQQQQQQQEQRRERPHSNGGAPPWSKVLGINPKQATWEEVVDAYRKQAKVCHPDAGGNHDDMVRLNSAFTAARAWYNEHEARG